MIVELINRERRLWAEAVQTMDANAMGRSGETKPCEKSSLCKLVRRREAEKARPEEAEQTGNASRQSFWGRLHPYSGGGGSLPPG